MALSAKSKNTANTSAAIAALLVTAGGATAQRQRESLDRGAVTVNPGGVQWPSRESLRPAARRTGQ